MRTPFSPCNPPRRETTDVPRSFSVDGCRRWLLPAFHNRFLLIQVPLEFTICGRSTPKE
jgi:hypothetical protein